MLVQVFLLSFIISLLGTIPPATINITVMQLSIKQKPVSATMLSLGAVIMDTAYAGLAVTIQIFLSEKLTFTNYFYLIAACVLWVLGIASVRTKQAEIKTETTTQTKQSFMKGIVLGLLNPLAMPFWLGVTTYLSVNGWINLEGANFWSYLAGVGVGEIGMLLIIIKVGGRFKRLANNHMAVQVIPGWALIILGLVNFYNWVSFYF